MMECTKIKEILPDYSVGGLSKKKREFLKQHLDNCPDCAQELMLLDRTASLLEKIPQEEPPDFLWEGVKREITQAEGVEVSHRGQERPMESQPQFKKIIGWIWGKRIPAYAASLAVLILVAGLYFAVWHSPKELQPTLYDEIEQQTFSYWDSPFADRAALGMLVINTSLEGEK
jgi:anti-sigma factor RsiW